MPKDGSPATSRGRSRGAAGNVSQENFNRTMKKAIKETRPRDKAPPLPSKKAAKSPPARRDTERS